MLLTSPGPFDAASGTVGQLVNQLAKHEGLKVIRSVGSDEKLDFIIKVLGFDDGFNYKKEKPADALARLAPKGLDIYYENVGSTTACGLQSARPTTIAPYLGNELCWGAMVAVRSYP
ncbi:hypothetical protein ABHI18_011034 [Aspergillus niger]